MNKPKFTPGPWGLETGYAGGLRIRSNMSHRKHAAAEEIVAKVYGSIHATENPNARLISAAPDMYHASKDLIDWLREFVGPDAWSELLGQSHGNHPVRPLQDLLNALAKADGRN